MHAHRQKKRIDGAPQPGYLDCGECLANLPSAVRRDMHCGYLPRLPNHAGAYPLPDAAPRPSDDVCPGYLIALPVVNEAQELYIWWEKGQLASLTRGRSKAPWLKEAVERMAGAHRDVEVEEAAEMARNRKR